MPTDYTQDALEASADFMENGVAIVYNSSVYDFTEGINPITGDYPVTTKEFPTYALRKTGVSLQDSTSYVLKPGEECYLIGGLDIPEPTLNDTILDNGKLFYVTGSNKIAPGNPVIMWRVYARADKTQ